MSGQVKQYGTKSIPDYKIDAFLHDVRQVADQAGLLAIRHMRAYDEEFDLLCFPVEDGCSYIFDYSYFEDAVYDKVVIDVKTEDIHSGNPGFAQFGAAVQALNLLVESYSDTFCYTDNRVGMIPLQTFDWLNNVLGRQVTLQRRGCLWDDYEAFMQNIDNDVKISSMDLFNSYEGNSVNCDEIETIVYVNDVINTYFVKDCVKQKEPNDRSSYGYWIRSMARFLWLAKRDSAKTENELLSHYMKLLHKISRIRDDIMAGKSVSPVKELFAVVAPPITVKLIATIYGLDFWQLWRENKAKINVTSSIFYHNEVNQNIDDFDQSETLAPITTEEFFGVAPEDRLYWWKEDGDVVIGDITRLWLEKMTEQHKVHCETMAEEFSAVDWHERLVRFLGKHKNDIKMFESLYCDFLNSFHRKEYRAWIEMLEVLADADVTECRRFITVLANQELRKVVFDV